MKRLTRTSAEAPPAGLPSDLTLWLDKTRLVKLTLEAVQEVTWENPAACFVHEDRTYRPQMLLTLLTYSYAIGQLESLEIARAIETDPTCRYLVSGRRLDRETLMRFRRTCRPLIEKTLAGVFESAWKTRGERQRVRLPDLLTCLTSSAGRYLQPVMPDFAMEAAKRIQTAVWIDSADREL